MSGQEWAELCQLDEEQFEARFERWQRVLGGSDEDPLLHPASVAIPHALLVATVFQQRDWGRDPGVFVEGAQGAVLAARVMDFSDDGPAEEGPFPDRMLTELMLDNTAAISFIGGAGNQRTRHLKVRGFKIRQLVQSGWTVTHCRGEVQKADLMTKVLSAARTRFLCDLLQLGAEVTTPEPETQEESVAYSVPASCLQGLLLLLQASNCVGTSSEDSETGVAIEWPWELGIATLLVVLSTLFIWEASGAPCRKRAEPRPTVRAVNAHKKDRRSRRLQEQVAAAIDSAVSESPTGDEARSQVRRSRNKCTVDFADEGQAAARPTVVYGGINMHLQQPSGSEVVGRAPQQPSNLGHRQVQVSTEGSSSMPLDTPDFLQGPVSDQPRARRNAAGLLEGSEAARGPGPSRSSCRTQASQTDPVIVLDPSEYVYISGGGDCVHRSQDCKGLRRAGNVKAKAVCQYCLRISNV